MTDPKDAKNMDLQKVAGSAGLGFFEKGFTQDPNKSTYENTKNYLNHLHTRCDQFVKTMNGATTLAKLNFALKEITSRLKLLEPYKNGYDFADDVLGVTILPTLGTAYALVTACIALYEGAQALYIHLRYGEDRKDDVQKLKTQSLNTLADAAMIFVTVAAIKLVSVLNLITRPFVTVINYMAESKKDLIENPDDKSIIPSKP